jgi:hypothetical protein
MLPPDGWWLQAELYSPASNKASSRPQAGRVLQLFDSPLTHDPLYSWKQKISLKLAVFRVEIASNQIALVEGLAIREIILNF